MLDRPCRPCGSPRACSQGSCRTPRWMPSIRSLCFHLRRAVRCRDAADRAPWHGERGVSDALASLGPEAAQAVKVRALHGRGGRSMRLRRLPEAEATRAPAALVHDGDVLGVVAEAQLGPQRTVVWAGVDAGQLQGSGRGRGRRRRARGQGPQGDAGTHGAGSLRGGSGRVVGLVRLRYGSGARRIVPHMVRSAQQSALCKHALAPAAQLLYLTDAQYRCVLAAPVHIAVRQNTPRRTGTASVQLPHVVVPRTWHSKAVSGSVHSSSSALSRHNAGEPASMQPAGSSGQRLLPLYGTDPGVGLMVSVSHHAQYWRQLMQSSGNRQRLGPYDCRSAPWGTGQSGWP